MKLVFKVTIPHTNRDDFDYFAGLSEPCIGARVWVPFRNKRLLGVVVGKEMKETPYPSTKTIDDVLDTKPLLTAELLALCRWISDYYQSPLSEVISLALPKKYRLGHHPDWPTCDYYQLAVDPDQANILLNRRAQRQRELLDFIIKNRPPFSRKEALQLGFTSTQLKALVAKGILSIETEKEKPTLFNGKTCAPLPLNEEQQLAVKTISEHLSAYHCFLLQGVTGSGKTEVYLQIIERVLASGKQVLVLVPEIGLTPQLLSRFQNRFSEPMAVIHSHLNDTERQLAWLWAKEEDVKLVIGTRAAIFTPMPALGLIVIDEEHDTSLKQMDGVRYSARDTALMRAHLRHIPIILGSATPSLESLHNCSLKKYTLLRLNHKAFAASQPLHYQILDVRNQPLQHGLAPPSIALIKEHLDRKNQVLVFINRRGFSPVLLCHQCGWMADCRACDAHLTVHRREGRLICHHCGLTQPVHAHCHQCKSRDLIPIGTGTQRVHEYLSTLFPASTVLRIDRDEVRQKQQLDIYLKEINDGKAQLIVGTQMLAKGHHFPRLTLVVVLDADQGFYNQDFRAMERLGQLITQVAGRAGREEAPGQVLIQTHLPQHPLLNVLVQQGYDELAKTLLIKREEAQLPPYHFLSLIRAQANTQTKLLHFFHAIKAQLDLYNMQVLGPAPAPLARKASLHRMQLLVKSPSRQKLRIALVNLREWIVNIKISSGIRWNIDVDPIDLS